MISRRRRVLLAAAFAIPIFVGATLGFFALRDAPEIVTLAVLALTGGALVRPPDSVTVRLGGRP